MNTRTNPHNDRQTNWQKTLTDLPWTRAHAERSAKIALSKANWLGIDRNEAIQQVFEVALGGFFAENPHIPFQAWQSVSEELTGAEEREHSLVNA
jgi:hypothetical protein